MGEQLGEGRWGPTFAATQLCSHGRGLPVAVKRLDLQRHLTAEHLAAFREQCELQVCLHHPHLLACYQGHTRPRIYRGEARRYPL